MPKSKTGSGATASRWVRRSVGRRAKGFATHSPHSGRAALLASPKRRLRAKGVLGRATQGATHSVVIDGADYVLVAAEEYERLVAADAAKEAVGNLAQADKPAAWVEADELKLQVAADRIAAARKSAGLTQTELGRRLGLPQSQISRIERHPDQTTVRTLRRIARALDVDVRALL